MSERFDMKRWRSLPVAAIYLLAVFMAPQSVRAADAPASGVNIITSPLPVSLVAKPGTTVSTDLKVKNGGTNTETFKVSLLKFAAFGEEGKPRVLDPAPTDTYFQWVKFSQNTFVAEPNVWKTIKMTIAVPKTAAFGYYYAVVFSRANQDKTNAPRETVLSGATATLVLLEAQVPGAKRTVDIAEFSSKHKLYEFLPASFTVRLRNTGNVHVAPRGNIFITQGKTNVGTIEVNPEQGNILPGSFRVFTADWRDGFPVYTQKQANGKELVDKRSDPIMALTWDFNNLAKFRFGKYNADMVMVYNDGKQDVPVESAITFYVVPWRAILVLVLVLAVLGFGLFSIIRRFMPGKRRSARRR